MARPSETVRRAKAVKKQAQEARDEARAASLDAADKLDAAAKANERAADLSSRAQELNNAAAKAHMEVITNRNPQTEAAAKAADKAAAEASEAADEARKAASEADAASEAAEKVAAQKHAHAEDLRDDEAAADKTLAAEAAAEEREAQRDRPEVSTEKEVDLDADDAADVRAEATAARDAMEKGFEENATTVAKARDDAAVERYDNEQAAKSAQMQAKREQKAVDEARSKAERLTREADAVEAKDPALAVSLRESARRAGTDQRIAESRLEAAQQRANAKLEASKEAAQRVEQLEKQSKDLITQRDQAEKAVDGLEERARLLEEAQQKLSQADQTGDPKLRTEAQALVERAEKVHVDRPSIEAVTTPVTPVTAPAPVQPNTPEPQAATETPAEDGTQVATAQGAPVDDDDLVGDAEPAADPQAVAMADQGEVGVESQESESDAQPADQSTDGAPAFASVATTESGAETDGSAPPTAPEPEGFDGQESAFAEEPAVVMAPAAAPAEDEFVGELGAESESVV